MKHEILFQNPVFHPGLNVTVRQGSKWMQVVVGETIILREAKDKRFLGAGVVVGKALLPVELVPESFLQYEHDPACQTLPGLLAELKKVYPDFSENDHVTVLIFRI